MRVSYSFALRDQNRLVYEADSDFLTRLPPDIAPLLATWLHNQTISYQENLDIFTDLWERWNGHGLSRIQLAPANLHWCSDRALQALHEYAEKYGVGMHMHLLETAFQKEYAAPAPRRCAFSMTWAFSASA
jgi:5-methylthioadenosine/S-adenosylhomocysteine deaminase